MVQIISAQKVKLLDLRIKFGLERTTDAQFFREWQENLPELNEQDKQLLDEVRGDYLHLSELDILEPVVKIVILAPLLRRAGFYRSPFYITAEKEVEISAEDQGTIVRGRIDLLVFTPEFWVTVIESKRTQFSLQAAIPQALAYMLSQPHYERPGLGFITNGSSFIFLKLLQEDTPKYGQSQSFDIDTDNDLYTVLRILKRFAQLVTVNSQQ